MPHSTLPQDILFYSLKVLTNVQMNCNYYVMVILCSSGIFLTIEGLNTFILENSAQRFPKDLRTLFGMLILGLVGGNALPVQIGRPLGGG